MDEETGNYYYGARYYDPKTSIWLSVDPLAEKYPGWSPYNYTFQNPVKLTDPDGQDPCPSCPWPDAFGQLENLSNYIGDKVDSAIDNMQDSFDSATNSIGNALDFKQSDGYTFTGSKSGLSDSGFFEEAKDAKSSGTLDGQLAADLAQVYGPKLGKIAEGTKITKDLILVFVDPTQSEQPLDNKEGGNNKRTIGIDKIKVNVRSLDGSAASFNKWIKDTAVNKDVDTLKIKKKYEKKADSIYEANR